MKLLFALILSLCVSGAWADEDATPQVVERLTCADIQAQISELTSVEEPDEEVLDEIASLKADYRRMCAKGARGRRSSADTRVVIENVVSDADSEDVTEAEVDEEVVEEKTVEEKAPEVSAGIEVVDNASSEQVSVSDDASSEPTPEQLQAQLDKELANLDAGLCADGSSPNRFGCCADEIFKDLGNSVFACCPKVGGDCYPPLK